MPLPSRAWTVKGTVLTLICLFLALPQQPPTELARAWEQWAVGHVPAARSSAQNVLKSHPSSDEARHLVILTSFATGLYEEAIAGYTRLRPDYPRRKELAGLIVDAYTHLNRLHDAARFARETGRPENVCNWLEARSRKPFASAIKGTVVVPFEKSDFLAALMPAVAVEINGKKYIAHLDTGGGFIATSEKMARELGITAMPLGTGEANASKTAVSAGIVDELKIGGAVLKNVPVNVIASLNANPKMLLIGTNIFEQFLTTWDNPGGRLILSARRNAAARRRHLRMIPAATAEQDFYLQGDHFLFIPGAVGDHKDLVFFLDTGLVTMDGRGRQPAIAVSPATLAEWGLAADGKRLLDCPGPVSVGPLEQTDHSLMVLDFGRAIPWHGVRVSALLSHGFMKKYTWTLDFDRHKLYFAK